MKDPQDLSMWQNLAPFAGLFHFPSYFRLLSRSPAPKTRRLRQKPPKCDRQKSIQAIGTGDRKPPLSTFGGPAKREGALQKPIAETIAETSPPRHSVRHDRQRPLTWAIDGIVIGLKDGSQPSGNVSNGNVLRAGVSFSRGIERTGVTRTGGASRGIERTGSPLKEKIK